MTYTVMEIAEMLGIGRTPAYNLVKENYFKVVKIGASIRVLKNSFEFSMYQPPKYKKRDIWNAEMITD